MWQDPTDTSKRKPRRLRGTPANKFSLIASSAFVGSFCLFFYWLSNSKAEWVLRKKERTVEKLKPKPSEAIRKEMFMDAQLATIVSQVNERQVAKEYAKLQSVDK